MRFAAEWDTKIEEVGRLTTQLLNALQQQQAFVREQLACEQYYKVISHLYQESRWQEDETELDVTLINHADPAEIFFNLKEIAAGLAPLTGKAPLAQSAAQSAMSSVWLLSKNAI